MSGKRFVDLAALVNATHGVAKKHITLRTRQLELYNRTSKVTQAIQSQTNRVTVTLKAASFIASRLNDWPQAGTSSKSATEAQDERPPSKEPIPSRESSEGSADVRTKGGLQQDHFYEKSMNNSVLDKPPKDDLEKRQEKAAEHPLPDGEILLADSGFEPQNTGEIAASQKFSSPQATASVGNKGFKPAPWGNTTLPMTYRNSATASSRKTAQGQSEPQIPTNTAHFPDHGEMFPRVEGRDEDSFYNRSKHSSPALSSLPRVTIPTHPANFQDGDGSVQGGEMNPDTFYSNFKDAKIPSSEAVPEQKQIADDLNTDIFHSPRIAKLLGGDFGAGKEPELELKHVEDTPVEDTKLSSRKDQDTFNVRRSSQKAPAVLQEIRKPSNDSTYISGDIVRDEPESLAHDTLNSEGDKVNQSSTPYELRESKVPSSRIGRLWSYGGLAAGMFGGAISESIRRVSGSGGDGSYVLTPGNMDRLVAKLSRMRGAALKLGQMISFQDSKMLPVAIQEVLQRVQDRADYMPPAQRDKVLASNLGTNWRDLFSRFDEKPLAAASIGQVHNAVLKSNGVRVAVKVQYPGVADSIDSDLNNLALLLTASRLLPKGLFLDKTIANARTELAWECDYVREAECCVRFRELLADEADVFVVPKVFPEASGKQVLTMEFMDGIGVTRIQNFSQEQRDWIGTQILRLCLMEIIEFRFMQTDPNWTNFLFNRDTKKLELLDFGASREYTKDFITAYTKLLVAASKSDEDTVCALSIQLGYLTGRESKTMTKAHIASVLTLAEPFLATSPELYDFKDQTITDRVKALIPIMIKERLAPPPEETYSLHRKLSGAFLLCARLGSRVRCRELFQNSLTKAGY